ncbi:hypothetical protein [Paenibacillus piri]|uniref:Uncharacterized protein n=1 Tax=Paenibacillus piri TaxID=2547395 RepID=A0A4R5KQN9_9BACL|nr:hypothetical protein [Paenibacillus piri]TDF97067.1 hypothetical protein E1757_14550 [Paenibacillus piri]
MDWEMEEEKEQILFLEGLAGVKKGTKKGRKGVGVGLELQKRAPITALSRVIHMETNRGLAFSNRLPLALLIQKDAL